MFIRVYDVIKKNHDYYNTWKKVPMTTGVYRCISK